ncbi:GrpB family protein [Paraliobacillus sp. JSM ZJ581]|uniref:GrpB family protein n=1 Tax=Paraliobacillus sp. JSM ZJ581 TaxID=3342118 RepID=UPI0035A8C6FC
MPKKLSEMGLEELWQLFPIILSEHKGEWTDWYAEESSIIHQLLQKDKCVKINHIGSTAIKEILAKPTVDILVEIPTEYNMNEIKRLLVGGGYFLMSEDEKRMSFNKGYTEKGFADKVFHVHVRFYGDNDELYFRDFMNENPTLASQYEELKLSLSKRYKHNRDRYTEAKGVFISECTKRAKEKYPKRYL